MPFLLSMRFRNRLYFIIVISFVGFLTFPLKAQEGINFEQFIQDIIPIDNDNDDFLEAYEILMQYYQHPLDINKAEREDLEALYILKPNQILSFLEYRETNGVFVSIYELQAIPHFDIYTIEKLRHFVSIRNSKTDSRKFSERLKDPSSHYIISRVQRNIELGKGYKEQEGGSTYLGDPYRMFHRYRFQRYGDYSFGISMEKDAGEMINWDPSNKQYGFDFNSTHIYLENRGAIRKIVLGDYQLSFGQGVIFSSGFGLGKGGETILSTRQNDFGINPYSSSLEYGFNRGIASTLAINNFEVTPFISFQKLDANIKWSVDSSHTFLQSIQQTGLHNTSSTIGTKSELREVIFGMRVKRSLKNKRIGITYAEQIFDHPIIPIGDLRNQYLFQGERKINVGLDYDVLISNFNLFGETAFSNSGGMANVHGIIAALNASTDLSLLYRRYDKNFHSIAGASFAENTRNINESGFYIGMKHAFAHRWKLSVYYDVFSFPWLKYGVSSPSQGEENLWRLEKAFSKNSGLFFQYKNESKDIDEPQSSTPSTIRIKTDEYILQYQCKLNDIVSIRSRAQMKDVFREQNSFGQALSQDVQINLKKIRFDFRVTYFETSDYNSRIYVLEKDLLYSFSAPAYFGTGARHFVMLKYNIGKNINIWLRWARTLRTDASILGSGNEEIQGNSRNELKFQVKWDL